MIAVSCENQTNILKKKKGKKKAFPNWTVRQKMCYKSRRVIGRGTRLIIMHTSFDSGQ